MILTCVGYVSLRAFVSSRYHNGLWKSTPSVLDHRHVGYSLVAFSSFLSSFSCSFGEHIPTSQLPWYFLRLMFEGWFDPFF